MEEGHLKFKKYLCFKNDWAGFDTIRNINVIIGKNNSGKSCLLDLVEFACTGKDKESDRPLFSYCLKLEENELARHFQPRTSGGRLGGNHWHQHGQYFLDKLIYWEKTSRQPIEHFEIIGEYEKTRNPDIEEERSRLIAHILNEKRHPLYEKIVKKLSAERDIDKEEYSSKLDLIPTGIGATNIINNFITNANLPRKLIQGELLKALNVIFGDDANFTEIQVQYYEKENVWEVFLGEENKGLIPLSRSGSGLKTIILVLLNLIAVPVIEKNPINDFIYLFEELENNIHPSLQRRLLKYILNFSIENNCIFFITTHSNVSLDLFSSSKSAQIIQVQHDGTSATTKTVGEYLEKINVVSDLGAKASDLLQANGIVWLEGPSDRIYFNKWIEILSDGKLKEGIDYQCAFYGGSLLAKIRAEDPQISSPDKTNILTINSNIVAICDGDRTAQSGKGSKIKERTRIIKKQINKIPGSHIWITEAKEIESYIPTDVLKTIWGKQSIKPIDKYEPFWRTPTETDKKIGYFQKNSPTKTVDKVKLAFNVIEHLTREKLEQIFEWKKEMEKIYEIILGWNESK